MGLNDGQEHSALSWSSFKQMGIPLPTILAVMIPLGSACFGGWAYLENRFEAADESDRVRAVAAEEAFERRAKAAEEANAQQVKEFNAALATVTEAADKISNDFRSTINRIDMLEDTMDLRYNDRWPKTDMENWALRFAIENPGIAVPDPLDKGRIIKTRP